MLMIQLKKSIPLAKNCNSEMVFECDVKDDNKVSINFFLKFQKNGLLLILLFIQLLFLIKMN